MNNLKDFERARKDLEFKSKHPEDVTVDTYKQRDKQIHTGLTSFVNTNANRSDLFRSIGKGAIYAGAAFVAGSFGVEALGNLINQAKPEVVTSLLNTGMTLLGGGAGAMLAKRSIDKNIERATDIRKDVLDYRKHFNEKKDDIALQPHPFRD